MIIRQEQRAGIARKVGTQHMWHFVLQRAHITDRCIPNLAGLAHMHTAHDTDLEVEGLIDGSQPAHGLNKRGKTSPTHSEASVR